MDNNQKKIEKNDGSSATGIIDDAAEIATPVKQNKSRALLISVHVELASLCGTSVVLLSTDQRGHQVLSIATRRHIIRGRLLCFLTDHRNQKVVKEVLRTTLGVSLFQKIVVTLFGAHG
jgi:hypothetical protein